MKYMHLSITELHELLVAKKVTPLELTKEALELAKSNNDNAFEYIAEKEALDFAATLIEPEENNLIWGIPFVLKDNFSTKDIPTTGSSDILKDYVPIFSSEVASKLIEKKAVLIGKTTLDELAMGGSGTTGHLGISYNPWDPTHTRHVGGSSCGSAICAAAGIVPFAIGSDTGDSVRKPASYAGLVGFKPTWGRISRWGLFPFATSMDHVAYFTRNVLDSAILLSLLAGRDEKDSTSSDRPVDDYVSNINDGIKGKKIAVIKEIYDCVKDPELIKAFDKTIENLKAQGAIVDFVSMDEKLLLAIYPTYMIISCSEATSNNANLDGIKFGLREQGDTYQEIMTNTRTKGFSELIRRRFIIGSYSLLKENQNELFLRAQKARRLIVDRVNEILNDYDVIYTPASTTTAPKFDESLDKTSNQYLIGENHLGIANFGGLPSITLPIYMQNGLPFGANFTGRAFEEKLLFTFASSLEETTGLKNIVAKEDK
jgi:aspartyl-tRNA(Asn)/glutamyl-tRNA(Gln) amidotransferase subunit A